MKTMMMMMVMMMMALATTTATSRCAGACVCMGQRLVCRRTLPGRMLAPGRVRELDLRGLPPSLLSGWRGVAGKFPNLHTVDVRGSGLCLTAEPSCQTALARPKVRHETVCICF